jgi:hypothetical protein
MEEAPEVPIPPPEIPRGRLWTVLLPLTVTLAGTLLSNPFTQP